MPLAAVRVLLDAGGNALSVDDEKAKLRLVVETASEVWGE
jgi:hypothetical protein